MAEGPRLSAGQRLNPRLPLDRLDEQKDTHLAAIRCAVDRARFLIRPHNGDTLPCHSLNRFLKGDQLGLWGVELVDIGLLPHRGHEAGTVGEQEPATDQPEYTCNTHVLLLLVMDDELGQTSRPVGDSAEAQPASQAALL